MNRSSFDQTKSGMRPRANDRESAAVVAGRSIERVRTAIDHAFASSGGHLNRTDARS